MAASPDWPRSLLLVGCGNMGGAMLAGWLAGGIGADRFTIVDPRLEHAPDGVALAADVAELAGRRFDVAMLGIKPQGLAAAAPALTPFIGADTTLLSLLAGAELATLARLFPDAGGIVRIMPNLAVAIGRAPVALAGLGIDAARRTMVTGLMAPLGAPEWIDEGLFDAVTALAGSGPAFVYRYIDALAQGAAALGIEPSQAQRLALATVEGAALLAAASPDPPGELARKVASPGGSTLAGLEVLDAGDALARLVEDTLRAATCRNAELAALARG